MYLHLLCVNVAKDAQFSECGPIFLWPSFLGEPWLLYVPGTIECLLLESGFNLRRTVFLPLL